MDQIPNKICTYYNFSLAHSFPQNTKYCTDSGDHTFRNGTHLLMTEK